MRQLVGGGYRGVVYPVNPKYDEVSGLNCYPALGDVPDEIDLAVLVVPNHVLEDQMTAAAEAGVKSAVIFASGYEERPGPVPLIDRLTSIARESGIVVCGGNCMGFVNFEHRLRALAFSEPEDLEPGPVAWISHSGSAFTAVLHNDRGLRFNLAVSAGQEFTTTVADYMHYALGRDSTGLIALFIETVRDPENFRAALEAAAERDVPVVALKVGRAEAARDLVAAHSGAMAGEDAAFDAVFDACGVMRVATLNEMADVVELLSSRRRAEPGLLATIHDSGGERANLIDIADDVRISFASLSETTVTSLEDLLEPGLPAVNPLDAWGTGHDFERIFGSARHLLADDPAVGAVAFVVDLAGEDLEWGYARVAEKIFGETRVPFAVISNLAAAIDPEAARRLRAGGVPVLEDVRSGLLAFRHLLRYRDFRALSPPTPQPVPAEVRARWRARLEAGEKWDEVEALALVADYGIPVAASERVTSLDGAIDAAGRIGYPVALKIAGAAHKSDAGGVRLDIKDENALVAAYRKSAARFGPHLVVQAMAKPGVELALGVVGDPQFGPLVMVAAGGTLVEVLRDRRFAMPPLDEARASALLEELAVARLLHGVGGAPTADMEAVAGALVRLSVLAVDLGPGIAALDVNPLVVRADGCTAVDALVIPSTR